MVKVAELSSSFVMKRLFTEQSALVLIIVNDEADNSSPTTGDCGDKEKVPYFGDMIAACIDPDAKKRPSTACVKNHLLAFQEVLKGVMKSDEASRHR